MFTKTKTPPEPEDIVKLKPILGIRPGVYLAAVGAVVLLLVLFLILLYPGITRPGSLVVFTSEPSGAALRVDGVYRGTSPCRVFVPQGECIAEVVLPGFETERINRAIPGRLFASALFPRRYPLSVPLTSGSPVAALEASAADYAAWTFGGEPTATWQIPLSLSEGVYRIGPDINRRRVVQRNEDSTMVELAIGRWQVQDLLAAAARFAVTRAALRDLVRAETLAENSGNAPSPLTLTHSAAGIAAFLADNPGSAAWLADTLPADSAAVLISSAWYLNQLASFADVTAGEVLAPPPAAPPDPALPASQIRVGGLLFTGVGGGMLVQGEPFPHQAPVEAFFICVTEVLAPAYADFLDANPQWRPEQTDVLVKQGLADNEYLADFDVQMPGGRQRNAGISAVSWHAARAFCEWLGGKLPDSFSGWELRLPTEAEWEYAAKSSQKWGSGIFDGGIWEWCDNLYSPLPFLSAPANAVTAVGSPERAVRGFGAAGGSGLNVAGSIVPDTRASLPPATCSAFVSFRPVIVRRESFPVLMSR